MLRVRPIISTTACTDYAKVLRALGMNCVQERTGWQIFDSGNGKLVLQALPEGEGPHTATRYGFELRDAAIFVQRTLADGTQAELLLTEDGPTAKVVAPDGFSFMAHPSTDLSLPQSGPTGSRLAVIQTWTTPRPEQANTVLANIGAKHVLDLPGGGALFRAKNGGLAATAPGEVSGVVLGLMYDGDLSALAERLTDVGVPAALDGNVLHLNTPGGGGLTVAAGQAS